MQANTRFCSESIYLETAIEPVIIFVSNRWAYGKCTRWSSLMYDVYKWGVLVFSI